MKCKQNAEETCMDYPNKCHLCGAFDEDIYVPTNADRIRAMDDELLATQLAQAFSEGVEALTKKEMPDDLFNEVMAQILEKLKQPAEGD